MSKSYLGIFLLAFFCSIFVVHASCDYETQNSLKVQASNVVANCSVSQVPTGIMVESPVAGPDGVKEIVEKQVTASIATIYNLTEDLYITVKNLNTSEEKNYYYSDSVDGTITWQNLDLSVIVPYEIKIFSNHADCYGEELAKLKIVSAKINDYAFMPYCSGLDTYYCQKYITEEITMSEDQIKELAYKDEVKLRDEESHDEVVVNETFWSKYRFYILGVVILIGVVSLSVIIIRRRQRSEVL